MILKNYISKSFNDNNILDINFKEDCINTLININNLKNILKITDISHKINIKLLDYFLIIYNNYNNDNKYLRISNN